jgi:hypothetical protein
MTVFLPVKVKVNSRQEFYDIVKVLNEDVGTTRENWYCADRPLHHITYSETKPVPLTIHVRSDKYTQLLEAKLSKFGA